MNPLKSTLLFTPIGQMIAVADETWLYLLDFTDRSKVERKMEFLKKRTRSEISPGRTKITDLIKSELEQYFSNKLRAFQTPMFLCGTAFQKQVWEALQTIPFGTTKSYAD